MAAVSMSYNSLKRTLGSGSPRSSLSPVGAVPSLGWSDSSSKSRWRRVGNDENANAIVCRCLGGNVRSDRNGWSGGGVVATPRNGALSSFCYFNSYYSLRQRRMQSSSSRLDREQSQPLPMQYFDAYDNRKFDPSTHQRNDVPFDPIDGKPPISSSSASLNGGKIQSKSISWDADGDKLCVAAERNDGSDSHSYHSKIWIDSQVERWRANPHDFDCAWPSPEATSAKTMDATKRVLWSNWTESMVRDPERSPILFQYDNLVRNIDAPSATKNAEEERLLRVLYQYGLVLITGTPTFTDSLPLDVMSEATKSTHNKDTSNGANESAESAILRLAAMIGYHPLQTLYGSGVWSTSSSSSFYNNDGDDESNESGSASTADSAYGSTSLPLHTDMTYLSTPPGVQIFLMVQPATATASSASNDDNNAITPKGQSVYLDGFSAARQLLSENPDAFRFLATTPRRYRCVDDEEGWHLEATGLLIETVPGGENEWGPVTSIRHNDLDRLPGLPPYTAEDDSHNDDFYQRLRQAHEAWDDVLRLDSMRLAIDLGPGDCVLVANQRCMHGRYAFETSKFPRVVMGCYVGMDELSSKWRKCGLRVL